MNMKETERLDAIGKVIKNEEIKMTRKLLKEYHEYVAKEFPITGFGEASMNNFIAHRNKQ